ncbi:hypothetical protein [Streptomyces sp. NPDC056144]|uniref:hypothetical protein n=1 Tax=unclassified Streptomyces TaxID=2593676 RepID=UPI0035E28447
MPHTDDTQPFLTLSARLTGFDESALVATGLTETYRAVARERLGAELYGDLLDACADPAGLTDEPTARAARSVTYLWYTGSWPGPPPTLVSGRSYTEALVWKAAGIAAPATAPRGYGSWSGAGDAR